MKNASLLLVDDDEDQLIVFGTLLESHGYRVHLANSAVKAMSILEKEEVDCVISDVMMPRPNGRDLIRALKGDVRFASLPTVMLTAGRPDLEQQVLESGADHLCLKRDAPRYLIPLLNEVLGKDNQ